MTIGYICTFDFPGWYKNKNFDKFEELFVSMDVFRYIDFIKYIFDRYKNIDINVWRSNSNNREIINIAPSPLGTPWQKLFYWIFLISLVYMEILVFKFERPISNNKENKMFAPPPWDAPGKFFFLLFLWLIWNYWYLWLIILSIIIKKIKKWIPSPDTPLTKKYIFYFLE